MRTVLDTQTIDPSLRFTVFRQAVCEITSLGAYQTGNGSFHARIQSSQVGSAVCSFLEFDAVTIERRLVDIASERASDYLLALHLGGNVRMQHLGRNIHPREGDFSLFDSALPYLIEADSPARRIIVRFPRSEFIRRGLSTQAVCARVYRGDEGSSGLASRLLCMLAAEPADFVSQAGHSFATTLLDLIAESPGEKDTSSQIRLPQDRLLCRIRTIVLSHLADTDLSVARVAAMTGISVRYLHAVFGTSGTSLHQWIEDERLERARRALTSPHLRTIQTIALDSGFHDPSYFARRFLKKYGQTPSQWRAAHAPHEALHVTATLR